VAEPIYSAIASLDGCVADEEGNFDWAAPDDEVHAFVNDLERPIGTYLYGRRMYEVMRYWENAHTVAGPAVSRLRGALAGGRQGRVLEDPAGGNHREDADRTGLRPQAIREMKASADRDLSVGGPGLAARAIEAGLVDEPLRFVAPIVVGGGTRWLPGGVRIELELVDERRFGGGVVFLRYRMKP
jgi:dihydrofolate reductase